MLLITGMPRSGTSYTQMFFNFAHKNGDERYFAPDQHMPPMEFLLEYGVEPFAGRGSLLEDGWVYKALYEQRHEDIPEVLSNLEKRWEKYGEPVLKHPALISHLPSLRNFSRVIITYCDVVDRWIESVDKQFGRDNLITNMGPLFGDATDILDLGCNWAAECYEAFYFCEQNGIPVNMIKFGFKEDFEGTMKDLHYDQQLIEDYWSQWRGSRFSS